MAQNRRGTRRRETQSPAPVSENQLNINIPGFKFPPFDVENESWKYYIQRFELELSLHGLLESHNRETERVRKTLLLSRVGPTPFKMIVDHCYPRDVMEFSYGELKNILRSYYTKTICILAERVKFGRLVRQEEMSVTEFIGALRGVAGQCEFGNSLDERMRDQLVLGLNSDDWQRELIKMHPTNSSTLADVQASALILEQATVHQNVVRGEVRTFNTVQRVEQKQVNTRLGIDSKFKNRKREKRKLFKGKDCLKCGFNKHEQGARCPASDSKCLACDRTGHFARVCVASGRAEIIQEEIRTRGKARRVRDCNSSTSDEDEESDMRAIQAVVRGTRAVLKVIINNIELEMLYDSGASHTVVSEDTWHTLGSPELKKCRTLFAYTQMPIQTLGRTKVEVKLSGQTKELSMYVVRGSDSPLFGLDWIMAFNLLLPDNVKICQVKSRHQNETNINSKLNKIFQEHSIIFSKGTGKVKDYYARIHLNDDTRAKIFKPRQVPFALRPQVEGELERLQAEGIIQPINPAETPIEWASPMVVAIKSNGKVRLCADFKVTINKYIAHDRHPLPRFEEVASKLSGGTKFTAIDLRDAYLQIEVHPDCEKYFVITTHKGYFIYKRLPFGVSSAPAIFQRLMDCVLGDMEGVACYLDDVVVTGKTVDQHLARVKEVLQRLEKAGMKVNKEKCKWLQDSITYLGHRIDKEGIHPTSEKIEAMKKLPKPTNMTQLRAFLGSINYYGRFIANLQTICAPLHRLTKKGGTWRWTEEDNRIFERLKSILTSSETLVHFDPDLPLILTTDASDVGIGAVLFHVLPNGATVPIGYASRSLKDSEKRYAAIDKEALAIIFGVNKFHQYLYAKKFVLKTDHKPLERILGENSELPKTAANRLTRWAIHLNNYHYTIQHTPGTENGPADALSRLPLPSTERHKIEKLGSVKNSHILHLRLSEVAMTKQLLQKKLLEDRISQTLIKYNEQGWPKKEDVDIEVLTYYDKKDELSYEKGYLLWHGWIIIPAKLRLLALRTLHEGHPGCNAMKSQARLLIWWPGLDRQIEDFVKCCAECQKTRDRTPETPICSWTPPNEPWSRFHLDYMGPFQGRYWLIIVDSFTKWIEVYPSNTMTSEATITCLNEAFCRFGLPRSMVSDNGPQFTSKVFRDFCISNNIKHIKITPYHARSNGQAERAVKTIKRRMEAALKDTKDHKLRLQQVLMSLRNSDCATTGRSPAEMMFGRHLRTKLTLLKPSLEEDIRDNLLKQKINHDKKSVEKNFKLGELVWVLEGNKTWKEGVVQNKNGELSYEVEIEGVVRRKHADHLRTRQAQMGGGEM